MRKFVISFFWVRDKIKNYPSSMGIGTRILKVKGSRRFSLSPEKNLEEKAQKIWKTICDDFKYNRHEVPEFIALEEIQIIETKVAWRPSEQE